MPVETRVASQRSIAVYAVAPVALAVVVDRVVAVIRRHVLANQEPSARITLGRAAAVAARIAGLVLLYMAVTERGDLTVAAAPQLDDPFDRTVEQIIALPNRAVF